MKKIFFSGLLGLILLSSCARNMKNEKTKPVEVQQIQPDAFVSKMKEPSVVVLDVRTPEEFGSGHIPGAVNVDYNNGFERAMEQRDKTATYLVYCQVGGRSSKASQWMVQHSFTNVYNLTGGFEAWKGDVAK
jgi:rhodanese-related sulfurtransferase